MNNITRPFFAVLVAAGFAGCATSPPSHPDVLKQKNIRIAKGFRNAPKYVGAPSEIRPLWNIHQAVDHPFMGANSNSMHADAHATEVYDGPGPRGYNPRVDSRAIGRFGGQCPSVNFNSRGQILAVCVKLSQPSLYLIDPDSLQILAAYKMPPKDFSNFLRLKKMATDTAGGMYAYVDNKDRVVFADSRNRIQRVQQTVDSRGKYHLTLFDSYDMHDLVGGPDGNDRITSVLPDWDGRIWFVTRGGQTGYVNPEDGRIEVTRFNGEEIQNSFSIARDGVYIVSDRAMYRLAVGPGGKPDIIWREPYDPGSRLKPGQINQGSGTTPTIIGDRYLAIADNAEPRMNVIIYDRLADADRRVCSVPVFSPGRSATENSMVAYGNSVIIENNYGTGFVIEMAGAPRQPGGIARVDFDPVTRQCEVAWTSPELSPSTVPKMSLSTGLLYVYTREILTDGVDAWYFTGIDFRTGETVFRILTGTGIKFDNNWSAITLAPDGSAWVGTLNGLVSVRDQHFFSLRDPDLDQRPRRQKRRDRFSIQ